MKLTLITSLLLAMTTAGNPVLDGFFDFCKTTYEKGREFSELGLDRMADWYYGQSVVAVESLNYAVREIYRDRKEKEEMDELNDDMENLGMEDFMSGLFAMADALEQAADKFGDAVADMPGINYNKDEGVQWSLFRQSTSLVSPYEDFFRGVVADYRGEGQEAMKFYCLALMNPYLDRDLVDFSFLGTMSLDDMYDLSYELDELDRNYSAAMSKKSFYFSLPALLRWSPEYLRWMAMEELKKENKPDVNVALRYCEAALMADPFDPVNYEITARLCAMTHNFKKMERIVNDGLMIDPDNVFYQELLRIYDKYVGE
jgi:hypothetical protein